MLPLARRVPKALARGQDQEPRRAAALVPEGGRQPHTTQHRQRVCLPSDGRRVRRAARSCCCSRGRQGTPRSLIFGRASQPLIRRRRQLEAGNSQKVSRLELQNKKLQQELEEFQRECAELKNQEVTVRRLEEKVREYEQQMEVLIAAKVQEVQQQFQEIQQDILAEKKERELELQRQLQQADREAERARQACDAAQTTILDLQATHGNDAALLLDHTRVCVVSSW